MAEVPEWSSEVPIGTGKTNQKEYREYKDRFLKRSLAPSEYTISKATGLPIVPRMIPAQLENEAAALCFIKTNTNIPVPKVLAAYEKDGLYYLWTEMIPGVTMKKLSTSNQELVAKEVEKHVVTLQSLRSRHIGGPTGIVCVPHWLTRELPPGMELPSISSTTEDFVFCHMDLGQSNILVDPETLKINAIIDWEFAGFFPSHFEGHYYRSPTRSGEQYKAMMDIPKVVKFFTVGWPFDSSWCVLIKKQGIPETEPDVL
jgi:hypothetical protein